MSLFPPASLLDSAWLPVIARFIGTVSQALGTGQRLTSWYRNADENAAVGGHPESQHVFGLAIDLSGSNLRRTKQLAQQLRLTAVMERDHLHIQAFPPGTLARAGVRFPRPRTQTVAGGPVDESERFA